MAPEGEVLADTSALVPLILLWYAGAGVAGACGTFLIHFVDSMDAEKAKPPRAAAAAAIDAEKEAACAADMLVDHHGSNPSDRDAAVALLVAAFLACACGLVSPWQTLSFTSTFGAAFAMGHASGRREALAAAAAAPAAPGDAAPAAAHKARPGFKRPLARSRPSKHGVRRVRSANSLLLGASLSVPL